MHRRAVRLALEVCCALLCHYRCAVLVVQIRIFVLLIETLSLCTTGDGLYYPDVRNAHVDIAISRLCVSDVLGISPIPNATVSAPRPGQCGPPLTIYIQARMGRVDLCGDVVAHRSGPIPGATHLCRLLRKHFMPSTTLYLTCFLGPTLFRTTTLSNYAPMTLLRTSPFRRRYVARLGSTLRAPMWCLCFQIVQKQQRRLSRANVLLRALMTVACVCFTRYGL
jgi:hypothetical protein